MNQLLIYQLISNGRGNQLISSSIFYLRVTCALNDDKSPNNDEFVTTVRIKEIFIKYINSIAK